MNIAVVNAQIENLEETRHAVSRSVYDSREKAIALTKIDEAVLWLRALRDRHAAVAEASE